VRLLVSARSWEDLLYRDELTDFGHGQSTQVQYTLTRAQPRDWRGFDRRVDAAMLRSVGPSPDSQPAIFVCGPTAFVEQAADALVVLGHRPGDIHTERFGPTGR
ncbi:MAG: oxidoreductase, partial [Solirubrobacterales bacterium]|nr:oxidoreductase [Solirubrobacterales bacterium]